MSTDDLLRASHAAAAQRRLDRSPGRVSRKKAGLSEYGSERETFPYWKVQTFEARSFSWKDVQEKHGDLGSAEGEGLKAKAKFGCRVRLMEVRSAKERAPMAEL
jgi:hypothetical protein